MNIIKAALNLPYVVRRITGHVTVIGLSTLGNARTYATPNLYIEKHSKPTGQQTFSPTSAQIARGCGALVLQTDGKLAANAQVARGLWSWFSQPATARSWLRTWQSVAATL